MFPDLYVGYKSMVQMTVPTCLNDVDVITLYSSFAADQPFQSSVQPLVPSNHILPEALFITSLLIKPAGTLYKALKADR